MKTYEVTLPIAGIAFMTVQANSEEEAIDIALGEVSQDDIEEWEAYRKISSGNVLYIRQNEASAEALDAE